MIVLIVIVNYDFYNRILLKGDFQEGIDYKEIKKDDALVINYLFIKKPSHNKKYYAVTENTYKSLLTQKSYKKNTYKF